MNWLALNPSEASGSGRWRDRWDNGNAKKALLEKILSFFGEARARRKELESSTKLDEIMEMGAQKARVLAQATMQVVYQKTGLN